MSNTSSDNFDADDQNDAHITGKIRFRITQTTPRSSRTNEQADQQLRFEGRDRTGAENRKLGQRSGLKENINGGRMLWAGPSAGKRLELS